MKRGFLSGMIWGVIISTPILAVMSLTAPLRGTAPPRTGGPDVPAGSEFNQSRPDTPATLPGQDQVSKPPEAASPSEPGRDALEIGDQTTAPGTRPETGEAASNLTSARPAAGDTAVPAMGNGDNPPVKVAEVDPAPKPPQSEAGPEKTTTPAPPPVQDKPAEMSDAKPAQGAGFPVQDLEAAAEAPVVDNVAAPGSTGASDAPAAPVEAAGPGETAQMTQQGDDARAPESTAMASAEGATEPAAPVAEKPSMEVSAVDDKAAAPETATAETAPDAPTDDGAMVSRADTTGNVTAPSGANDADTPGRDAIAPDTSTSDAGTSDTGQMAQTPAGAGATVPGTSDANSQTAAKAADADQADGQVIAGLGANGTGAGTSDPTAPGTTAGQAAAGSIPGKRAGRLTDRNDTVRTGRLPSITDTENAPGAEAASAGADTARVDDPSLPPIRRYAVEFANPESKPLMTIILIDDGKGATDARALTNFPYPVTIALDPAWNGAAQAMSDYRDAGFEVMLMAGLDDGADARDLETSFETWTRMLPDVVGVLENPQKGLQSSKEISDQLTDILSDTGHGLVLYPNGFDTARKLADKQGVPAATVFRDFDSQGQSASVIRRFLDHAAFRAGQEDAVVMVGRVRPETVQALLVWGLQDRASRVALAPVSALLLRGFDG